MGNGHAVVGAGAPPYFVEDEQALIGALRQNRCRFGHFHHKGTLTSGDVVLGADTGKNPIDQADFGAIRRYKRPNLGHQHNQGHLAHHSAFAGHVGAGNDGNLATLAVEGQRIGDKLAATVLFDHRVASVFDDNSGIAKQLRAHIAVADGHFG